MSFANHYSLLDRMVHNVAFSSRGAQIAMSELEDRLFARPLENISASRPVFVTALPRAGTTLLLEMLEATGEFAAHIYRDMPLLLTPILWSRLSARFNQDDTPRERAHGDGMMVSVDSPEAFEETIWAAFWKQQYQSDRTLPWNPRLKHPPFEGFLTRHMKKIVYLRQSATAAPTRYLSKNNMNICRIGYLAKTFPDAKILVPFRDPLQHAASLLKQHLGFLKLHQSDPFAKRYMREIGHYDFGENLKPIDFNGWLERPGAGDPTQLAFWLQYWLESYSSLQNTLSANVTLLSFNRFTHAPTASLTVIARQLALADPARLLQQSARVTPPKPHAIDTSALPRALLDAVQTLHQSLESQALNRAPAETAVCVPAL